MIIPDCVAGKFTTQSDCLVVGSRPAFLGRLPLKFKVSDCMVIKGSIDANALQKLANIPRAGRFLDARTGHINVIEEVEGWLIRIHP